MDKLMSSPVTGSRWRQVNLWCDDWQAAEQMAVAHLGPRLADAQHAEIITSWWFVRKGPSWRVRCLPAPGQDEQVTSVLERTMQDLATNGTIRRWVATIYEPEIHAFGGVDGMDVAHHLFHADSCYLLSHLRQAREDHRRELGLLLGSLLMRAAGQDWYEQGDVWARVAAHRLINQPPLPDMAAQAVHRLIAARTSSAHSPVAAAPDWPAAFERAGQGIADLAHEGSLTRGARAVLAHHILFAWNRAGIPARQQALLAAAASRIVFQQEPAHGAGRIYGRALPVQLGSAR
jgi:protein-L-isoaspartate(D-aspartate) O-methyltransferase